MEAANSRTDVTAEQIIMAAPSSNAVMRSRLPNVRIVFTPYRRKSDAKKLALILGRTAEAMKNMMTRCAIAIPSIMQAAAEGSDVLTTALRLTHTWR